MRYPLDITLNGQKTHIEIEPHLTLLEVLRDDLGLSGTKEGCGTGDCGACTVLVNGDPVCACLILAAEVEGQSVVSVEGLSQDGALHPLQRAFIEEAGLQCGFCTPGMLLSAFALLESNPAPTDAEIRLALAGNLCRCTGYDKILRAVSKAAEEMRHG